ncbi:DUF4376 domain-containing protein [Billgrantia montanilacus]|uniref:DUF4376 domain-containing protein n=1 Tax=Billgrantia montanilacus TaxID=2282305 RepID=A0A368TYC6_9GAMM|nr:DUF4376 domain-containing protein [Halomonas montanilacus]RCV89718.1 DUF4376 domain-containing protein [Halomonas montanilacus]
MRIWDIHPTDRTAIDPAGREAPRDPMRQTPRVPAGATSIEPPETSEHEAASWNGEGWELVPDWRGHVYWSEDGERHEISELGTEPPADALAEVPPEPLSGLAARKCREIDAARDHAFAEGLPLDIAGEPDVVQTRPQDKTNLLGIAIEARQLDAEGVVEAVLEFRGLSNVKRTLTPQQAIDLTNEASTYIKSIYQRSWDRKDAIDAALEAEDREGIEGVVW